MKYRIEIDEETCIGDQLCCNEAPKTFEMNTDDKAIVTNPQGDEADCIRCAAESCPVDAIALFDVETGEKVYPK